VSLENIQPLLKKTKEKKNDSEQSEDKKKK
jgi:hypothetical protein